MSLCVLQTALRQKMKSQKIIFDKAKRKMASLLIGGVWGAWLADTEHRRWRKRCIQKCMGKSAYGAVAIGFELGRGELMPGTRGHGVAWHGLALSSGNSSLSYPDMNCRVLLSEANPAAA